MKPKYILIYSEKADRFCGSNLIKTVDGKIVRYTNMAQDHDWKKNYGWDDSQEVGFAHSANDIVEYWDKPGNAF